jgi:hypothetical protein
VVTGERLEELARLYAAFAKEENPLDPLVRKAETQFDLLLRKSYGEQSALKKANMTFESFRWAVIPDIEKAAFDNVRRFPTILPEVKPRIRPRR